MNLADITTKCYILALIIRDDGERLLLGDGAYEFKDSQQHFIANIYANDVVELQGTDGQMLAGQVRRTAVQTFAGYIGDATFSKQKVEEARRDFLMFFRKKHYYTAVYVFSDGTAIQRKRGYIVNAPSAPELYQRFPEWSIGLNFEDPNYYEYAEDDLGHEIAAHKVELELSTAMSGGLIWDGDGAVSDDLSYVGTEIEGEGKNFQLTDTGTATLKSAELLGDASQTTYSGKNLFHFTETRTPSSNSITVSTTTNDSSFTINGTSSGSGFSLALLRSTNPLALKAGTYTLKIDGLNRYDNDSDRIYIAKSSSAGTPVKTFLPSNNWTGTFTTTEDDAYVLQIIFNASASYSNKTITIQLEKGSTATDYEPYVGGTTSPNPDYPQAVNTVTGEQTVKIEGKNLLELQDSTNTSAAVNFAVNNGTITASGTTTRGSYAENDSIIPTLATYGNYPAYSDITETNSLELPAGTYTLSAEITKSGNVAVGLAIGVGVIGARPTTSTKLEVGINVANGTYTRSATVTVAEGQRIYPSVWYEGNANAKTVGLSISNIQLELGSTATAYEPYQGQEFKVNLGKNLFDGVLENGSYYTVTSLGNRLYNTTTIPITVGEQYTVSLTGDSQNLFRFAVNMDSQPLYIKSQVGGSLDYDSGWKTGSFSFTATYPYVGIIVSRQDNGNLTPSDISNCRLQLELGSQATPFSPYFTPIELAKIGNYQDRIYKSEGKWYIEKQVGKAVFNGSETGWDYQDSGTDTNRFRISVSSYGLASGAQGLCNNNEFVTSGVSADSQRAGIVNSILYYRINKTTLASTTVADFKTWVASNNIIVYTVLATPITTEITNSELVGQLERLRHSHTYADTTNFSITATSPNLPAFLEVVAFGDDAIPQGGYVWEDGGSGGATIITVDGVDNAQPIWTVVGPATNPSLTNITTGESIQWTGVVPNGQTLVVNMADMTASLSGANVFEFISGSWITLQAGNNRVSYSATAATGIATLEWNGVVG